MSELDTRKFKEPVELLDELSRLHRREVNFGVYRLTLSLRLHVRQAYGSDEPRSANHDASDVDTLAWAVGDRVCKIKPLAF